MASPPAAIATVEYDDDSDDKNDAGEGLEMLLGGLCIQDIIDAGSACDDNEEESSSSSSSNHNDRSSRHIVGGIVDATAMKKEKVKQQQRTSNGSIERSSFQTKTPKKYVDLTKNDDDCYNDHIFNLAHKCSTSTTTGGKIVRPSVKVVQTTCDNNKGMGLIATEFIPKGSTIYTERAALATQVPSSSIISESGSTKTSSSSASSLYAVKACQDCFRSLEPALKSPCPPFELPMSHLWPVLPLSFSTTIKEEEDTDTSVQSQRHQQSPSSMMMRNIQVDKYGRVRCRSCGALFCSVHCYKHHNDQQGSCCTYTTIFKSLLLVHTAGCSDAGSDTSSPSKEEEEAHREEEEEESMQPAVALAVRMFGYSLLQFRKDGDLNKACAISGLCGEASDLTSLEIGTLDLGNENNNGGRPFFTLKPMYSKVVEAWDMTTLEQKALPLDYFHKIASMAGRNGVGIMTQSPFQVYYASLLRATGGRNSDRHEGIKKMVASAVLGSDDGELTRGMDKQIDNKVAVEVVALFPLTARINHSCSPNAQIRSQEFVDCYMDLVAMQDIRPGEEITISYIATGRGVGKKRTHQRQRELERKYLFYCNCTECTPT